MGRMEKVSKVFHIIILLVLVITICILLAQKESTHLNFKNKEKLLNKDIKLLKDSLLINNFIKDSLILIQRRLKTEVNYSKKEVFVLKENLLEIKGKYKILTIDSSLNLLKKRYEMDSISDVK